MGLAHRSLVSPCHSFSQFLAESPSGARISSATIYLPGLRRPLEKVSKVGHFSLFEREPAASVVRANLVSRVILIFRINQATQLLFSTKFSYWAILILLLFISSINKSIGRLLCLPFENPGPAEAGPCQKRASSRFEAGTSGLLSISDSEHRVPTELGQESQASSCVEEFNSSCLSSCSRGDSPHLELWKC